MVFCLFPEMCEKGDSSIKESSVISGDTHNTIFSNLVVSLSPYFL
jgi:hypothetical protein